MNRVYVTGKVKGPTHILYTPEGQRIMKFLIQEDEEGIEVEVYYKGAKDRPERIGEGRLMVFGSLAKRTEGGFLVRAKKILFTEE